MQGARWLAAAMLGLALAAPARAETERFYAYAYDLASGTYLYTEVHAHQVENGKWVSGTIRYYLPDGSLLGSKTLDFRNDPFVPIYRMDLGKEGYMEGITDNRENIVMIRRKPGGDEKSATVKKEGPMGADSGFHPFIVAHFDELMRGETIRFRFAAAGELDTFKFRGTRIEDTTFEGKPAVVFKVEPDSVLRLLAGPLLATYDPKTKKLLEYRGISNVHDPVTHKAYNVRIDYYSSTPPDAPKLPPLE